MIKNVNEFKELIEKYSNITIEALEKAKKDRDYWDLSPIREFTGFGTSSCSLCTYRVKLGCKSCIYSIGRKVDKDLACCSDIRKPITPLQKKLVSNYKKLRSLTSDTSKTYFHLQERIKLMREYLIEYEEWEKNNGK